MVGLLPKGIITLDRIVLYITRMVTHTAGGVMDMIIGVRPQTGIGDLQWKCIGGGVGRSFGMVPAGIVTTDLQKLLLALKKFHGFYETWR